MAKEGGRIERVPVKISGIVVGQAVVYSDGRIVCDLSGTTLGKMFYDVLRSDFARSISLVPNVIPATPVESQL